ncbi:unnamed protein product [Lymnaea stagnalis]|uniref:Uncharacterized protein n=1 Tax=Lymnaea stagnalis TaxID=6523 RepID=A0AAV2H3Y3_LYMST
MVPIKFHHHQTEGSRHKRRRDYEYDPPSRSDDYSTYHQRKRYDSDPTYGQKYRDFYSDYTPRSMTPLPRREVTPTPRRHITPAHRPIDTPPPERDRQRPPGHYDHHNAHIHYISARSEPPLRYETPRHAQQQEVVVLKPRPDTTNYEPRIAMYNKRRGWRKWKSYCGYHSIPEKSSKNIPSMYYDELRCPHCAAHVQPSQDEVLAYPWTVQSYRPNKFKAYGGNYGPSQDTLPRRDEIPAPSVHNSDRGPGSYLGEPSAVYEDSRSVDPGSKSVYPGTKSVNQGTRSVNPGVKSINGGANAVNQRTKSVNQGTKSVNQGTKSVNQGNKSFNKGNKSDNKPSVKHPQSVGDFSDYAARAPRVRSKVTHNDPPTINEIPPSDVTQRLTNHRWPDNLEDKENLSMSRPMFRSDNVAPTRTEIVRDNFSNRPYLGQVRDVRSPTRDYGYTEDDVTPFDSISNVVLPPLRASDNEPIRNRQTTRMRAETIVDGTYTSRRFFQSLDRDGPNRLALPTPKPKKDTASEISRMLKGEYYDRRTGKRYEYNINYRPDRVVSERHPDR